ncbi:hypothetical protein [Blastococcus sp. CT_GayMR16]|uniref:hypothetical protein n=1 Tax=Blastococcus sp. CT_GayMR16 TaxID=2559607 RepID=UPI0010741E72|nr:hypothetical protein [Blastococcus sp. CT_GayMR16]TFV89917.1 hypothetical protein E4P38_05555 [Blastococcus sp. CT_GayMR16]
MYRRTTIAATTMALALLGGGTALATNAGLFGSGSPDGAGTVPAVATLDNAGVPSETTPAPPGPAMTEDSSTGSDQRGEDERAEYGAPGEEYGGGEGGDSGQGYEGGERSEVEDD